jgi:hypothetical protein
MPAGITIHGELVAVADEIGNGTDKRARAAGHG